MPPAPIALIDCNHFYDACEQVWCPAARDVIVASNNDGCAIARSPGARTQVPMGAPLFQYEDVFARHNITVLINARYGRDTLFLAAESTGEQLWKMHQVKRSPRYTTRWNELLVTT